MPLPPLERESEDLFFSAFTSETEDREDHSFSGVFFSIGCDSLLPVSRVEVTSLSVRGSLGRVRVYVKTPVKRRSDVDATREPNVTEEYGRYARGTRWWRDCSTRRRGASRRTTRRTSRV